MEIEPLTGLNLLDRPATGAVEFRYFKLNVTGLVNDLDKRITKGGKTIYLGKLNGSIAHAPSKCDKEVDLEKTSEPKGYTIYCVTRLERRSLDQFGVTEFFHLLLQGRLNDCVLSTQRILN